MAFSEEFVSLCFQTMHQEDYGDSGKRKVHNKAVSRIRKLVRSLAAEEAEEALGPLLDHADHRVRLYGASACREKGVLREAAVRTLREVVRREGDGTLKLAASMLLAQYQKD